MAFSKQESDQIKQQIITQLESQNIPNKEEVKQQILSLNDEQLDNFLKQNQMQAGAGDQGAPPQDNTPIFQQIVEGKIPSYKVDENQKAMAIMELNPLTKGHVIILPKEKLSIEKIPKSSLTLSQKIAKRIKKKLKPEDIKIESASFQDYAFINVIPLYKDQQPQKYKADENELKKMQSKLEVKKRASRKKTISKKTIKLSKDANELSFRIP